MTTERNGATRPMTLLVDPDSLLALAVKTTQEKGKPQTLSAAARDAIAEALERRNEPGPRRVA